MTRELSDYVPPAEWQTLNALDGFGSNRIAASDGLAGRTLRLTCDDGAPIEYTFHDRASLTRRDPDGSVDEQYEAREVLDGVWFVDYRPNRQPNTAVVLAVDLARALVTIVTSTVGTGEIAVTEHIEHGRLPGAAAGDRHQRTAAMVGRRYQYIYDSEHAYEHIYLNDSTYCWHCLGGAEQGQADAEPSQAYAIRPDVYLFCWRERVVPCDGVVVVDWVNNRLNGRIFGFDTDAHEYNAIPMGARAVRLNVTRYEPLD